MLRRCVFVALLLEALFTIWSDRPLGYCIYECSIFVFATFTLWNTPNLRVFAGLGTMVLLPATWGSIQLFSGVSVNPAATLVEIMQWLALSCSALVARTLVNSRKEFRIVFEAICVVSAVVVFVSLVQGYSSGGRILWYWPTGEQRAFGPFNSQNNFASFVVLTIPLVLSQTYYKRRVNLGWAMVAALMVAAVVASTSRAGTVLATVEVMVFSVHVLRTDLAKSDRVGLIGLAVLMVASASAVGWQTLFEKFKDYQPLRYRSEIALSTLRMAADQAFVGFGLGAFPAVYPGYAQFDAGYFVNFAHNDWLEFLSDGGMPYFGGILIMAFAVLVHLRRAWWGIGLLALCVHAMVDYPFQRLGLLVWIFTIATLLVRHSTLSRAEWRS